MKKKREVETDTPKTKEKSTIQGKWGREKKKESMPRGGGKAVEEGNGTEDFVKLEKKNINNLKKGE